MTEQEIFDSLEEETKESILAITPHINLIKMCILQIKNINRKGNGYEEEVQYRRDLINKYIEEALKA